MASGYHDFGERRGRSRLEASLSPFLAQGSGSKLEVEASNDWYMTYPGAVKVANLCSHHPENMFFLNPTRLVGKLLNRIHGIEHLPCYVHVHVVVGLATPNPCLQLLDNVSCTALVETLILLAGASPEVRKRIHALLLESELFV